MAGNGAKRRVVSSRSILWLMMLWMSFIVASAVFVSAESSLQQEASSYNAAAAAEKSESKLPIKSSNFSRRSNQSGYKHVWPELKFGWKIVVSSVIGFIGAACGSIGGVGGGGIFVPMLTLIIGFDSKSAIAMSKCMILGTAVSTVYFNLKMRHPTLDMPIIDYDLALLVQPMLMLGISFGVAFNVILADWMITVLLIILFLGISTKAFLRGLETWNKETIKNKEDATHLEANGTGREAAENEHHEGSPSNELEEQTKATAKPKVSILENIYWKELGLLVFVWVAFLALQIGKNYTASCSPVYWVLNFFQIPVSVGVSLYEAINLYKGWRVIASRGDAGTNFRVHQLLLYCFCGLMAGMLGGLLGLGGGFIMCPLFLELGVPPQVASATATYTMAFSSSMSVVEYYLLKRFPVPYALYLFSVATVAALFGQHVIRKLINILGRESLIIFILAFIVFASAISLGGVGISNMVRNIERHGYMGFENICK